MSNNFPVALVQKSIDNQLSRLSVPGLVRCTVPKKQVFASVPYLSPTANREIKTTLRKLSVEYFPQIDLKLIFKNEFSVQSFFRFKDRVPVLLRSNIVYKFNCGQCTATYYGETRRHLKTRVAEHRGLSARTGQPLSQPPHSSIRDHAVTAGHDIKPSDFSIAFSTSRQNLHVSESILIHANRPSLNNMESSAPLHILS